ncbi:MAG: hypothetical protein ACI9TI_000135 [Natronomonas sp.]
MIYKTCLFSAFIPNRAEGIRSFASLYTRSTARGK